MAAPIQATRKARSGRCAPILVPTMATSGPPNPKTSGNEQIFEARAGAVTGDGGGTEGADKTGGNGDREIGLHRDQRRDRADAQNVGEQRPAQTDAADCQANDASSGAQIGRKHDASRRVIEQHGNRAAGDAEFRKRSEAEDQAGRQRNEHDDADDR